MARSITIEYAGGETETVKMRPLGLVAAERQYGAGVTNGHSIEASLWAAWFLKGKPGGSFDAWLETVDAVQEKEDEPVLPLAEEPSAEQ